MGYMFVPELIFLKLVYVCRCELPHDVFNGTDSYLSGGASHSAVVDMYIPRLPDGSYDTCNIYTTPKLRLNDTLTPNITSCDSWVYDKMEVKTSIVSQVGGWTRMTGHTCQV